VPVFRDIPKDRLQNFNRHKEHGLEALNDRSQRPVRYANQLPEPLEKKIVRLKQDKPHWGVKKVRELFVRWLVCDVRIPAKEATNNKYIDGLKGFESHPGRQIF